MVIICDRGLVFVEERGINSPELLIFSNDYYCSANNCFEPYDYTLLTSYKYKISSESSTHKTIRSALNDKKLVACWKINLENIQHLINEIHILIFESDYLMIVSNDGNLYVRGIYYANDFEIWTNLIFDRSVVKLYEHKSKNKSKNMIIDIDGRLSICKSVKCCDNQYILNTDLVNIDYNNIYIVDVCIGAECAIMSNGQLYNYNTRQLCYKLLPPIISIQSFINRSLIDENGHLHFYRYFGQHKVITVKNASITQHVMTSQALFFIANERLYYIKDDQPVSKRKISSVI